MNLADLNTRRMRRYVFVLARIGFAAGLVHLSYQVAKHWGEVTLDFRFFWLAGEFWANGVSPYGQAFTAAAEERFGIVSGGIWYYTPNWLPVAVLYSLVEPLTASRIWSFVNAGLLLGASALNVAAFRSWAKISALPDQSAPVAQLAMSLSPRTLFFGHAGFMALAQATGNTIHLGQSSLLIYFGASLLVYAYAQKRLGIGALSLALLMLKPQLGLFAVTTLFFSDYGRRVIFLAAPLSLAMALPAFAISSPPEMIAAMLTGISQYTEQAYNLPSAMTGVRHIFWQASAIDPGTALCLGLGLSLTAIIGMRLATDARATDLLFVAFAAALVFAPLHVYDFGLAGTLMFAAATLPTRAAILCIFAYGVFWRAGNLLQPTLIETPGYLYYPGSLYASLAMLMVLLSLVARWCSPQRTNTTQTPRAQAAARPVR